VESHDRNEKIRSGTNDEVLIDARGHRCPVPTLRLRRAAERAGGGQLIRLLADDPLAKIDVPHFAREAGLVILEALGEGQISNFLLKKPA